VAIIAALIAIAAIGHAICVRNKTKKESQEQFNFISNLVMYSSSDPDAVSQKMKAFRETGTWGPVQVIRLENGKLSFAFDEKVADGIGLKAKPNAEKGLPH
jgi:hypothetical protein